MRWITESRAVAIASLLLAAGALASCATSSNMSAGGAAGIAALAHRNPNSVYRSVLTSPQADVPPRPSNGASGTDPDLPTR